MKGHEVGTLTAKNSSGMSASLKDAPAQDGAGRETLHDAAAENPDMIPVVVVTERRVPVVSRQRTNDEIGDSDDGTAASGDRKGIIGRDDRAHHLALGSSAATPGLLPPKAPKAVPLPSIIRRGTATAVKRHSSADDKGRCGVNGYCDPWDENGCGGLYCGRRRELG
ncbi:MAG TPA: hypothetical protein VEC35_22455 [Noviherbaspirillum sp.]|nr:hypothetical protein [Noviherbaspirillum sp.]